MLILFIEAIKTLTSSDRLRFTHPINRTRIYMLTRNYGDKQDFNAIEFELAREQIFNRTEQPLPIDYEVDCDSDWYGQLYRVWNGRTLLGTFHQQNQKWIAEPFYRNRQYIKLDCSMQRSFNSDRKAVEYIVESYQVK